MNLQFKKLVANAVIPSLATSGSAGADLTSVGYYVIEPGETVPVSAGLAVAIPPGYCMLLLPRSGLAAKARITLGNSPGLIDSDYRGELKALVHNEGTTPFVVNPGDRICQMVIVEEFTSKMDFVEVSELNATERGTGGFGSTGVK